MSKLSAKIKHEFLEMLPPTIYFFVILHLIAIIRGLMILGTGMQLPNTISVTIAALVLGKSVLIANLMPFVNRFPERPLIWNVVWKSVIYALVALFVHYLEHLYDYWKETHGLVAANHQLLAEMNWPRFWAIQLLLLTLIVQYCIFSELSRVNGRARFRRLFFGPMPVMPTPQPDHPSTLG